MLNAHAEKSTPGMRGTDILHKSASEVLFPSSETAPLIALRIYPMGFPQHGVPPIIDARTEVSIS